MSPFETVFAGRYNLRDKINPVGYKNCFISEITVAEMNFGCYNSEHPEVIRPYQDKLTAEIATLPIIDAVELYGQQKALLKRTGQMIDDFDILIGSTAIVQNPVLVTNNVAHHGRLQGITIQNWTTGEPR